ncbi:hypothetical protein [Mesorhizobium sp. WSM3873]|uniref:hypothetical protein n=1 Tax=Mesorhizobium sp. WSM3873 TaxID=1854056 RepID=UPI0018D2C34A|nr:hypothetical protein [Mesorhizobium sp. WSM3873]
MNFTTARIFPPLDFRFALCHRFAAIASPKSWSMSSAVNGLSTMFGDERRDWAVLWGDRPEGARGSDHHQ